jgi:hypothetical protein
VERVGAGVTEFAEGGEVIDFVREEILHQAHMRKMPRFPHPAWSANRGMRTGHRLRGCRSLWSDSELTPEIPRSHLVDRNSFHFVVSRANRRSGHAGWDRFWGGPASLKAHRDPPYLYRKAFSTACTNAGSFGDTCGSKRATTVPSRPIRNFVKFQRISPPVFGFCTWSVKYR